MYSPAVENLITQLARLPGIGRRTAQRLAFYILRSTPDQALALADAIREVKEKIGVCEECFNLAEGPLCSICADARRDRTVICVVEDPSDVVAVERTHEYRGVYHVLGGALSPIDGVDPEHLRIAELLRRGRGERGGRGGAGDQPDDDRRGHRRLHRRPAARPLPGDAAGQRAAGGR